MLYYQYSNRGKRHDSLLVTEFQVHLSLVYSLESVKSLASDTRARRKHQRLLCVQYIAVSVFMSWCSYHADGGKSIAFLKYSPAVSTNLASGVTRSFLSLLPGREKGGTTNGKELSVGRLPFVFVSHTYSSGGYSTQVNLLSCAMTNDGLRADDHFPPLPLPCPHGMCH